MIAGSHEEAAAAFLNQYFSADWLCAERERLPTSTDKTFCFLSLDGRGLR
jgi:hypothetical protein